MPTASAAVMPAFSSVAAFPAVTAFPAVSMVPAVSGFHTTAAFPGVTGFQTPFVGGASTSSFFVPGSGGQFGSASTSGIDDTVNSLTQLTVLRMMIKDLDERTATAMGTRAKEAAAHVENLHRISAAALKVASPRTSSPDAGVEGFSAQEIQFLRQMILEKIEAAKKKNPG